MLGQTCGNFARIKCLTNDVESPGELMIPRLCQVWWNEGVYWACFLSLPRRKSDALHNPQLNDTWSAIICSGCQFSLQQRKFVVWQQKAVCAYVLASHDAKIGMDDEDEWSLRDSALLFLTPGCVIQEGLNFKIGLRYFLPRTFLTGAWLLHDRCGWVVLSSSVISSWQV